MNLLRAGTGEKRDARVPVPKARNTQTQLNEHNLRFLKKGYQFSSSTR